MADNFTETPIKGKKSHNGEVPGNSNVGVLPAVATAITPTFTEGNQTGLSVDLAGNLRVALDGSQTVTLDAGSLTALESITATLDAGSLAALENITIGTSLPAGDNNIGNVDIVSMPAVALDTATLTALENTTVTVGNASLAVTGPLTDAQLRATPISVTFNDTSGTIADSGVLTTVDLAAGASSTFNSPALTTGTPKLVELTASASVRLKVVFQTFDGATATSRRVFFVEAHDYLVYTPKDPDIFAITAGVGVTYRLIVTNMDDTHASDVYASLTWSS